MRSNNYCQLLILSFLYRYLSRLKSYVQNRVAPERSIAEVYIVVKCLTFCSRFIEGVEIYSINPPRRLRSQQGQFQL